MTTHGAFDTLFTKNVDHILEKIFLSLDYKSFKTCLQVSTKWKELLTSGSYLEKAKSLYRDEIDRDKEKIWFAAQQGNIKKLPRMVSNIFIDVNCLKGPDRSTPLCEATKNACDLPNHARKKACRASLKKVIQLLLDRGANPNLGDRDGWTPLLSTNTRNGNEDIVQLLLEGGADPDLPSHFGTTVLHLAAENGNRDVVQLLIDRGAELNSNSTTYGFTPLHYAALTGHGDIVRLLLKAGAEPNPVNKRGETPLSIAQSASTAGPAQFILNPLIGRSSEPSAYMEVVDLLNKALEEQLQ